MHVNDVEALAMRLRSLVRRADMFGKSREAVLWEVADVAKDLESYINQFEREQEDMYLAEMASRNAFQKEYENA